MILDKWQKEVLETKGNLCICSPRQMGKSTVISQDAGEYGMNNPNKSIMIVASVERQALLLFEKVLSYIYLKDRRMIMKKKVLPLFSATLIAFFVCICFAEQVEWKDGGPKYLYIKSGEKPPRHSVSYPYDEQITIYNIISIVSKKK